MYKFTSHVSNAKLVLVRRNIADGSASGILLMRLPKKQYSSNPDKCTAPPPSPPGRKLFYGALGATILTGAAVVYAKNSPQSRNWLESNVPWFNDFVALVYQENTTYWKASVNKFNKASSWMGEQLFGKEGVTPPDTPQRKGQDLEKDAELFFAPKSYELPAPTLEPLYVEEKGKVEPNIATEATMVQTDKCEPEPPLVVKITKDLVEIEHDMHENTKIAIDNYKKATAASVDYNKALYKIVESSLGDLDKKYFNTLQGCQTERDNTYKVAFEACAKARCAIETLDRMIKAGVQAPPENIAATKRYLQQFRSDLKEAEDAYKKELENAVLSERYWNKVEQAREMFKDELTSLFPGLDITAKKLDLRGDTDLLLLYAVKQVQFLQNEVAKLQTVREMKIARAIECHDEKAIIEAKVDEMIQNERMKKEKEFLKKSLAVQAEANRQLKEQLRKQFEIQQDVLASRLAKKEAEILAMFNRTVSERVEAERCQYKKDLAAMAGKLQAIEQTLKSRAQAESNARRSQSLWAAAEALLAATRRSTATAAIDQELKALQKAGKDDTLVTTVLKGIPDHTYEKGVATEKALRDRFETMEKTALKVALIGRDGASLPVYFLSWLQSKLLFQKYAEIPKDELDNLPTDFTQLDTFDIIQRAKYHMERGDMGVALRYVNLLQGAARAAARPWADAARAHLEVRQAAEAVMAHAAVAGLLYL